MFIREFINFAKYCIIGFICKKIFLHMCRNENCITSVLHIYYYNSFLLLYYYYHSF